MGRLAARQPVNLTMPSRSPDMGRLVAPPWEALSQSISASLIKIIFVFLEVNLSLKEVHSQPDYFVFLRAPLFSALFPGAQPLIDYGRRCTYKAPNHH